MTDQFEFNNTYVSDCDEAIKYLKEQNYKFDLVLTDPPYNIGKNFGGKSTNLKHDSFINKTKERINILKNLLNDEGSIIWFGIHDYIGLIQKIMYDLGLNYRRMLIWHYENSFSRSKKEPAPMYEPILWFSKSDSKWTYNVDDLRIPYKSERVKNPVYYKDSEGNRKAWTPHPNGRMRGDVWECPTLAGKNFEDEKTEHPTQKPEKLITDLIKGFCPKNEEDEFQGKILDPFHGSGTLGACCEKLNLKGHKIKWLGFEVEEKWNCIAENRIKEITKSSTNKKSKANNDKENMSLFNDKSQN